MQILRYVQNAVVKLMLVIPAKAGIQHFITWMLAFAGMTVSDIACLSECSEESELIFKLENLY